MGTTSSHGATFAPLRAPEAARCLSHSLPAGQASRGIDVSVLDRLSAFCRTWEGEPPDHDIRSAWENLFETYRLYVHRVIRSVGISGSDLEDCAQEVWIEIVRRLPTGSYDPQRGRIRCWIFSIARNKAIDYRRAQARHQAIDCADLDFLPSRREDDPAVMFERKRRNNMLHLALVELLARTSSATFKSLYRISIEEQDCSHVAAELGLTANQVRYRKWRAKQSLRAIVSDHSDWAELLDLDGV